MSVCLCNRVRIRIRMKFHVRMLDYDAEERWKAILVHPNERVRDVILKVANAISDYRDIHLDSRGIPECDLATEPPRDAYRIIGEACDEFDATRKRPYVGYREGLAKVKEKARSQRVNVPYACAANLMAGHVPLFDGGRLYVIPTHFKRTGSLAPECVTSVLVNGDLYEHWLPDLYNCETAAVLPDGTPPPLPPPSSLGKRKRDTRSEADKKQALVDAKLCQLAVNELDMNELYNTTAIFNSDGSLRGFDKYAGDDSDKDDEIFPDDPNASRVRIPHELFRPCLLPLPEEERVTVGDARALVEERMEPFYVLYTLDGEGPLLFGPEDSDFGPHTALTAQIQDEEIDDDEVYTWGGSCRDLTKITPELVAWSRDAVATMELLSSVANRRVMETFVSKVNAIKQSKSVDYQRLKDDVTEFDTQMNALDDKESVAHKELELKCAPFRHKMYTIRLERELKIAKVLEEWHIVRRRMLATQSKHVRTQSTLDNVMVGV